MRFLTDENVSGSVVWALRRAGHNVLDVKEKGWYSISDNKIVERARKEKRVVVTHDKDFMSQNKVPTVLLRFINQKPSNVISFLLEFVQSPLSSRLKKPIKIILTEKTIELYN